MRALAPFITLLSIHLLATGSAHAAGLGKRFNEIVAFGESSTDTGNVSQAQCSNDPPYLPADGFPFYWAPCTPLDPSSCNPNPEDPDFNLSDCLPGYFDDDLTDGFDGRLTSGPQWVEFLADALGVERPRPSAKYGTNYAHAGAKVGPDATTVPGAEDVNLRVNLYPANPVLNPTEECPQLLYQAGEPVCGSEVPHINTQITQYLEERGGFNNKQLVVIWGGANDLRDVGLDPAGPESAIANIVSNLVTAVGTAAAAGAKHIAVLNQPNAARAPITQALCGGDPDPSSCLAQIEAAVQGFNAALSTALQELQPALRQQGFPTRLHHVDVYSAAEVAVELSELFGKPFTNTTDAALIPNPQAPPFASSIPDDAKDYLFWDVIHPTGKAYRIIAYQVCKTLDRQIPGFKPRCVKIFKDN